MADTSTSAPVNAIRVRIPDDRPARSEIGSLPVSDSWKLKLRLIRKAGGPKMPNLKALSSGERFKISFNFLAFLFGPFYYMAKGMWKKGLSLFVACVVGVVALGVALELAGFARLANSLGYGVAALFAVRASVDYYKKTVLGENGWW